MKSIIEQEKQKEMEDEEFGSRRHGISKTQFNSADFEQAQAYSPPHKEVYEGNYSHCIG